MKLKDIKIEAKALTKMRVRTIIVRSSMIKVPLKMVALVERSCQTDNAAVNDSASTASLPAWVTAHMGT